MKKFIFALLLSAILCNVQSQESMAIDQIELIKDLQIWDKEGNNMTLAFWIPTSYWRIALSESENTMTESIDLLEEIFGNYVFISIADLTIDSYDASLSYTPDSIIRQTISITDNKDIQYLPIPQEEIPFNERYIIESLKPMFKQMLGQMGEGMNFYLFEVKDSEGNNIINEAEEGQFTLAYAEHNFTWNLPIPSLLPPKYCPVDNEKMKGNWNYCPIHGEKLILKD